MTAPQRPSAREDLTVVELDGEAVVYDPETGDLHHLNPIAFLVFSLCDGSSTANEISAEIAQAAGRPLDEVKRHVRRFVRELKRVGLIGTGGAAASRTSAEAAHG